MQHWTTSIKVLHDRTYLGVGHVIRAMQALDNLHYKSPRQPRLIDMRQPRLIDMNDARIRMDWLDRAIQRIHEVRVFQLQLQKAANLKVNVKDA